MSSESCEVDLSSSSPIEDDIEAKISPVPPKIFPVPPRGVISIFWDIWVLLLVQAAMHVFIQLEIHVYVPYLYTRVHCCDSNDGPLAAKYNILDSKMVHAIQSEASLIGIAMNVSSSGYIEACEVPSFPPSSKLWSLSSSCTNKAYVQQTAQGVMGFMKPLSKLFCFFILPVGGTLADMFGRVPVLTCYSLCVLIACLLSALDSYNGAAWGVGVVYSAGCLFALSFQPSSTVLAGAVSDILGNDELSKARAFVMMRAVDSLTALAANSVSYFILHQHLENYTFVWVAFAGIAGLVVVVVMCCVRETAPQAGFSSEKVLSTNLFRMYWSALKLVARDRALIIVSIVFFLTYASAVGFWSIRTSYLVSLGFEVDRTILPEIVSSATVVVLSVLWMPISPKINAWRMGAIGSTSLALSFLFYGPLTAVFGFGGIYVATVLFYAGFLLVLPAFQTIISQRVEPEHQATCQATVSAVATLSAIIAIPLYSNVLFNATNHQMGSGLCPIVSMCLSTASTFLLLCASPAVQQTKPLQQGHRADE